MKKPLLTLLAFVMLWPTLAQEVDKGRFAKMDSLMGYLYSNGKLMGSLTIREKGKVVFENAYGFTDVQAKTPATPQSKYKIGQATEIFTATVVFQLIEDKKLTLNTRLAQYFPKVKNADSISIGNLLNHTSGIADYTRAPGFDKYKGEMQGRKAMLERIYSRDSLFYPGTRAEYSATNYLLLGYIVQDITGKTIKENITSRIINKLGLTGTGFFTKTNPKKKEAYSYTFKDGKWVRPEEWHESVAGADAGMQSTPEDLTLFMHELFTGKLLKKETLDLMTETEGANGMGLFYYPFAERRYMGHVGYIEGYMSVMCYYPKENLSFSLLLNAQNYNLAQIINGILSVYYKIPYRFPNFNTVVVDEAILKSYEGSYATPELPFVINVKAVNGQLRIYAEEQGTFYVVPLNNTTFSHDSAGIILEFAPDKFILKQNGTETVFTRF